MSASAITDAFITNLSAASVFGAGNVDTDFSVLERSSACCCVVGWTGLSSIQDTFGMGEDNSKQNTWTYSTRIYLKDTGSACALMRERVPAIIDKFLATLQADDTLQGTVEEIISITSNRNPDVAFSVGGQSWLLLDTSVQVREYS